jgi:ABC-type proline/glycine betaine transport system permease subunit
LPQIAAAVDAGLGFVGGLVIVLLAILLDRMARSVLTRR